MITPTKLHVRKPRTPAWHAAFMQLTPVICQQARFAFRQLDPEARADAVQEVMANTIIAYAQLHERGRAHLAFPSVLVRYAVAQFRRGRRVGTRDNSRDLFSPLAKSRRGVYMNALDQNGYAVHWRDAMVECKSSTPADIAAFRIDFAAWLKSLHQRQRGIARLLAAGETSAVTARRFEVSAGRISQIRRELEQSWREFQKDTSDAEAKECNV